MRNASSSASTQFVVGWIVLLLSLFTVHSQTTSSDRTLEPPRKDLVRVHFPDLSSLEQNVREQILAAQNSLAATVKDPATSPAVLAEGYGQLGQIYHAYSLGSSARECYLNASLLTPNDFRWIYLLGKLEQQEGRFEEATSRFRVARSVRPDYLALLINLGNIFLELNHLEDAKQSFADALKLDQNNPAACYGLGQVAMSQRNYAAAVDYFERTLAQVPAANRVHYSLAMAYRGLGDSTKVKIHLAQQGPVGVRAADPLFDGLQELVEGERLHLRRGKVAFDAQRYSEAAIEFRKAVAAKPDSVTARINLGAALTKTGDSNGAVEQFEEAIRIEPARANAHYNLAVLLATQNNHDEAINHLRAVLRIDSSDLGARFLLGQELIKSNRLDEAEAEFARVVEADPNNEAASIDNVRLLYQRGQFKQALDAIDKSHTLFPQKGRTAAVLAYLLATSPATDLRNGNRALDLARRVFNATHGLQHGALVALALSELGRCNEAAEWQRRMIVSAEQNTTNATLLERLRAGLKDYENKESCRPPGDSLLTNLALFEKIDQ
jgi:tetratricopeptide (TPR) repeat protein